MLPPCSSAPDGMDPRGAVQQGPRPRTIPGIPPGVLLRTPPPFQPICRRHRSYHPPRLNPSAQACRARQEAQIDALARAGAEDPASPSLIATSLSSRRLQSQRAALEALDKACTRVRLIRLPGGRSSPCLCFLRRGPPPPRRPRSASRRCSAGWLACSRYPGRAPSRRRGRTQGG